MTENIIQIKRMKKIGFWEFLVLSGLHLEIIERSKFSRGAGTRFIAKIPKLEKNIGGCLYSVTGYGDTPVGSVISLVREITEQKLIKNAMSKNRMEYPPMHITLDDAFKRKVKGVDNDTSNR